MRLRRWMVRGAVVLAGCGSAAAGIPGAAPVGASTQDNWAEVRVALPTAASTVTIKSWGQGTSVVGAPSVVGWGTSWPGGHSVYMLGSGGTSGVSGSTYVGSITVLPETSSPDGMGWGTYLEFQGSFKAGDVFTIVFFAPGASFSSSGGYATADGNTIPITTTQGSGSTAIAVAAPGTQGVAVATPAGAGGFVPSSTASPSEGIIGAVPQYDCMSGYCFTDWTTPDGRTGSYPMLGVNGPVTGVDASGPNSPSFAGPAGTWSWGFVGASRSDVIAAFAPIGSDWTLYE